MFGFVSKRDPAGENTGLLLVAEQDFRIHLGLAPPKRGLVGAARSLLSLSPPPLPERLHHDVAGGPRSFPDRARKAVSERRRPDPAERAEHPQWD